MEKSLFNHLEIEPPCYLFEKIIFKIKKEDNCRRSRKLFFTFFSLLIISFFSLSLSSYLLVNQIKASGIFYFLSTALTNLKTSLIFWQDFTLAILETLPIVGILFFAISAGITLSTLRFFLYKRRLLFKFFFLRHQNINNF